MATGSWQNCYCEKMEQKRILAITLFITVIFSCEDPYARFCWDCRTTHYDYYIKMDQEPILKHYTDSTVVCEATELDILLYEKGTLRRTKKQSQPAEATCNGPSAGARNNHKKPEEDE